MLECKRRETPYAMQWKGRLDGGWKYELPVSSLDIFPTALARQECRLGKHECLRHGEGEAFSTTM